MIRTDLVAQSFPQNFCLASNGPRKRMNPIDDRHEMGQNLPQEILICDVCQFVNQNGFFLKLVRVAQTVPRNQDLILLIPLVHLHQTLLELGRRLVALTVPPLHVQIVLHKPRRFGNETRMVIPYAMHVAYSSNCTASYGRSL